MHVLHVPDYFPKTAGVYVYDEQELVQGKDLLKDIKPLENGSYQEVHICTFEPANEWQREMTLKVSFEEA